MSNSIKRINERVSHLRLSWVGTSQEEAHDFAARWDRVMTQLFGVENGPMGVLVAMAGGLKATAVGYSHTEIAIEWMFTSFSNELAVTSGDGGTPTSAPPDRTGSPINQDYQN